MRQTVASRLLAHGFKNKKISALQNFLKEIKKGMLNQYKTPEELTIISKKLPIYLKTLQRN